LKFWVQFTEKYGAPWLIGKHPRSASTKETDLLLDSLENMVQDAVAVIPDDSSVEIKEAAGKSGSAEVYERLLHFCRSEVSIALLGQNQTTEANSNRASAQAGLEVTRDIRDGDAAIVQEAMNTLIRWTCDLNFGTGARPVFSMWEQQEVDKVLAERDEKLTRSGVKLTPGYFKRAYNLQDGDLDEAAMSRPGTSPAANFAEEDFAADQDAIDEALDALSDQALSADMAALLAPLFQQVNEGAAPEKLLGTLAELYPSMDSAGLQERLARALFVANLWGRLHA
jgi:phage gp29-like protein